MICIDQSTGTKTTEPLKTIAKVFNGKMRFGIYLTQSLLDEVVEAVADSSDSSNASNYTTMISCNNKIEVEF